MANFFDQFDSAPQASPLASAASSNYFDQFDAPQASQQQGASSGLKRVYITGQPDQPAAHQPEQPGIVDTGIDALKSFGVGLGQGAIGLAGLPGDLAELGARGLDYATRGVGSLFGADIAPRPEQEPMLGSGQIQNAIEGVTGKFYQPKTTLGNYARTLGEFAPAVVGGPETLASRFLTRAAAPAIASEGAGQLTKGTALEPVARIGGAVLGGVGAARAVAPKAVAAPTVDELGAAAKAAYEHPTVAALELHPSSIKFTASKITSDLNKKGFRDLTAPQTFSIVQELASPLGKTAKVADVQSVRTALEKVAGNFSNPTEQAAAQRAIRGIDDYLANLKPFDVAAGDGKAAAAILNEAKGNYAAKMRTSRLDNAEYRAELNAASAHSGGNINNATRQALKSILINEKKRRGFSPDEIAQMEKIVKGTFTGNSMRVLSKIFATTGMHGAGVLGSSIALAPFTSGLTLLAPVAGVASKAIANRSTANAIKELDRMTAMRSPLGASLPVTPPSTNPAVAGLLAGLSEIRAQRDNARSGSSR